MIFFEVKELILIKFYNLAVHSSSRFSLAWKQHTFFKFQCVNCIYVGFWKDCALPPNQKSMSLSLQKTYIILIKITLEYLKIKLHYQFSTQLYIHITFHPIKIKQKHALKMSKKHICKYLLPCHATPIYINIKMLPKTS